MKKLNYTGSSKLKSRIAYLLNRKAPLPLDGNDDPDWGSNGQVLSTDGNGNTTWVNQGGGDTVSWTQTQASGTKIAEIGINGTSQNVYVPTAPTVNDGTLTIQQNGTTVGTFSANQSGDTTVNLSTQPRDLTVAYASEIANYSDEWAWIQARLNDNNISDFVIGDYIHINVMANGGIAAEVLTAEIAGIDTYYNTGDSGHSVKHHIDWITKECYGGTVQWNTSKNNNGNSSNSSPILASNLKSWLDGTLYNLLDAKLKNVIKPKRMFFPYRYGGGTLSNDNSWGWGEFIHLWIPFEFEVLDHIVWSTVGFGNGQSVQYPIFANNWKNRIKENGNSGENVGWFTATATNNSSNAATFIVEAGHSSFTFTDQYLHIPICFRTMED